MAENLTLAITKIGDLLLGKRITVDSNSKSLENVELIIPEYQRPYKWTAKNVNQLLDDIVYARNETKEVYRVGTLILHRNSEGYNIVDGQQRTITFALILRALGCENVPLLEQKLADNINTIRNIPINFRAVERRMKNISVAEQNGLLEYIKENCEMIVVITENLSEAFQFFDSQNARGKKLYPHDLLKAYHLREMSDVDTSVIEKIVKTWEDMDQIKLSDMFNNYLYRLKEWVKGNKSDELSEHNIDIFKGITRGDHTPYAQYYKGAYAYADNLNNSTVPFVTGMLRLNPFQINTPIVAGKPFFDYAKHYFDILTDIRNNDKYVGYYINDNPIVKTLNLRKYRNGVGNRITRLMFDTAILLYVDRFCSEKPSLAEKELLENQFVVYAFIWAYSMRAQYTNVGWAVAQNYIMGECSKDNIQNSFNIYKTIIESDSPTKLLSTLADRILPLSDSRIVADKSDITTFVIDGVEYGNGTEYTINESKDIAKMIYKNYLHYFDVNGFRRV